jgi:hypothetical protein
MWMDRQTDMTMLIVTFSNFANAPKKLAFKEVQVITKKNNKHKYITWGNNSSVLANDGCINTYDYR